MKKRSKSPGKYKGSQTEVPQEKQKNEKGNI